MPAPEKQPWKILIDEARKSTTVGNKIHSQPGARASSVYSVEYTV